MGVRPPKPGRRAGLPGRSQLPEALLFLSPTLVVVAVFIVFPIAFSFYLSFHEWNMFSAEQAFVGLDNYARLVTDPEFWAVFRHTLVYTVGTVPVNMALALVVAVVLNKNIKGRKILRAAFFTPVIVSTVAAAVIWRWIFDPNLGLFNYAMSAVGLPVINWANDPTAAMASLIIVGVWKTFGINMVLFAAGLSAIPVHYYEAAEIDGAGSLQKFWRITVPLLAPTTLFILVLSIIGSFQVFDLVYVLTYGGPLGSTKVLVFYLYEYAFKFFDMGFASAVAYLLFGVLFVLTLFQIRLFREHVYDAG
ncbi:MAG: sugar ABC transporter permease [Rhodothermia bacterium]|nr:sugar ABC transporter permease [Rhodothermia bacterium]